MSDWQALINSLKQPGDDELARKQFGPNEPDRDLVLIEGTNNRGGKWGFVAGPLPENDALNATIQLHRKYKYLRFVRCVN